MFGSGKSRIVAAALLFVIAAAVSCSEKIASVEERSIDLEIWTSLEGSGQAAQASRFILTVTGPGILEPIIAELALSNGLLTGSVVVSAGPDRVFRIDAYDQAGTLIYSGQTIADVVGGSDLKLDIDLAPRVPMIKASPFHVETLQGDLLAITIGVYHLPDVASLSVSLASFRSVGQSYIVTSAGYVSIDPQLAKVAASSIRLDASYVVYINLSLRNVADRMVDANGYTEIATVYYQTGVYEVSPYETATFTPELISMTDKLGNDLPTDDIRAEESVALLYDYWTRRIAFWDMGYGENLAIIYDLSDNALNGTATGTSVGAGARGGYARFFNGSGDFVEVPDNALLDAQDEITISMWIYLTNPGLNPRSSLICKRTKDGPINYQLLLEDASSVDGIKSLLFRYGSPPYHTYRVDVPDNESEGWFHVLFSYRFGEPSSAMMAVGYGCWTGDIRIPGAWITGTGGAPAPNTGGALFMGKDDASTTNYFVGGLDEVELFDIVWTPGLVQYYLFTGCR
jgi:hypothetical protein